MTTSKNEVVARSRIGQAYFVRFFVSSLFFIPLYIYGITLPSLILTLLVRGFIANHIEVMYAKEFAALYLTVYQKKREREYAKFR